jgi:type I restriction enzyme S subunit
MTSRTAPISWKLMPLSDICLKVTKGTTPTTIGGHFTDDGIKFIKVETISEFGSLEEAKVAFIDEESHEMLKRSQLEANDILFSIAGAIGRTYLVKEEDIPANTNQALAIVRFNQDIVSPSYGFYALRAPYFQSQAFGRIVQCAQANVNLTQLSMSKIFIPPKIQQEQIVKILSAYDSLIENNRRRIQLLEESARLLYREWFVYLRFPGHEHVRIIDGVPEEWELKRIENIAETIGGGTPSTKVSEYWDDGEITWFIPSDLTNNDCLVLLKSERKITDAGLKDSSAKMLPPETILMTSRATLGFFGLYDGKACTNQGFISIIPRIENFRMYMLQNLIYRKEQIISLAGGTTYKEINKTTFRKMNIVIPSLELLKEYEEFAYNLIKQVRIVKKQNQKLIEARHILLPRLMNGEITV